MSQLPSQTDPPEAAPLAILALDDDADFRAFLKSTLESDGHEVRTAGTPEEFYALVEASMPDVVLLDMKMGRSTGEEVLEQVRQRWPRLCVVVVTGYPSLDDMRATFKRDVFDYIAKPFSQAEMRRVLSQAAEAFGLGRRPQDRLRSGLGRQIRLARAEKGWTLRDLSEAAGVSISQLSSIERGAHLPSLESLLAVAQALEAKPSEWFRDAGF